MKSIATDLVQKSELNNKEWFIKLISELSPDDFRKFCKEVMFLRERYDSTVGLYVTDVKDVFIANYPVMWELEEIDFDGDVNFKKID